MNNTYFNYDNNNDNNTGNNNYAPIETPSVNPFGAKIEDNGSFNSSVPEQPATFTQPTPPVQQQPFNPVINQTPQQQMNTMPYQAPNQPFNPLGNQVPPQQFNPLGNQAPQQNPYGQQQFNPLGNTYPNQYNTYQEPQKEIIPGGIPNYNMSDEQLIDAYMGPEASKFRNNKFNVGAFFFGMYYFVFRKMYIETAVIILINIALAIVKLAPGGLVLGVIYGFIANSLYCNHAARAVQKIKAEAPSASMQHLTEICSSKGGTSLMGFLVLFFLTTILPIIIIFTFISMNVPR